MEITTIPWLLAFVAAAWFGLMARGAGRNWVLWGLGGALFALVTSTIVFGLGSASCIPFSDHDRSVFHLQWTVISVVLIAAGGWLLTMSLHRHHLLLLRRLGSPTSAAAGPTLAAAQARPETPAAGSSKPPAKPGATPGQPTGTGSSR